MQTEATCIYAIVLINRSQFNLNYFLLMYVKSKHFNFSRYLLDLKIDFQGNILYNE